MKSYCKTAFRTIRMPVWVAVALLFLSSQPAFAAPSASSEQEAAEPTSFDLSVVDKQTAEPVADAEISVSFYGKNISDDQKRQQLNANSEGSCNVVFPVATPEYVRFNIKAAGYVPISASWRNREDAREPDPIPESFVFPLEKGTSIGGVVKNEDGEPVEGVEVHLLLAKQESRIQYDIRDCYSVTDAQGKWRSDVLPEKIGELWMNLKHPDYITTNVWNTIPVPPMKDLRDFTSVMVLKKGLTLSGIVRDEKGNPVHNALVQLGSSGFSSKKTRTDERGRFTFGNCEESRLHISVQAKGKAPQAQRLFSNEIGKPLEFILAPGNSIRIRVLDPNGTALAGVNVNPETYQGYRYILKVDPNRPRWTAKTDEKGFVVWDSAPPDAVEYAFYRKGYARLSEVQLTADGKEHTITLPKPLHVVGTVVDKETGEPIPSFRVVPTLDWLTGSTPFIERSRAFQAKEGRYEWKTGRTDTGHYVRIEAKGYQPAMSKMLRVGQDERIDLKFELERGRNVEGRLIGIDGEPLEGAEVMMCTTMQGLYLYNGRLSRSDSTLRAGTAVEGRFCFAPEPEPFLLVVVHDRGYAETTKEESAVSGRIQLQPWARIEGKLVQGGKPVSGHQVRLSSVRVGNSAAPHFFARYYSTTGEEGEFVFDRVAPGPVSLSPDLGPWEQSELTSAQNVPIVAKPGQTIQISLGTDGRTVTGKVVLPSNVQRDMTWDYGINYLVALKDGIPAPDEIRDLDFDWRRGYSDIWNASREGRAYFQTLHKHFVKLKPDGSFRINGVEPGKYEFVLRIYDPPRGMG